jgi:hypothetical protein
MILPFHLWTERAIEEERKRTRKYAMKFDDNSKEIPGPFRIIIVRHGESEGNVDESAYARLPDWQINLTDKGRSPRIVIIVIFHS